MANYTITIKKSREIPLISDATRTPGVVTPFVLMNVTDWSSLGRPFARTGVEGGGTGGSATVPTTGQIWPRRS